jgi:hypothetical protein
MPIFISASYRARCPGGYAVTSLGRWLFRGCVLTGALRGFLQAFQANDKESTSDQVTASSFHGLSNSLFVKLSHSLMYSKIVCGTGVADERDEISQQVQISSTSFIAWC